MNGKIASLLKQMTIEEKISFASGSDTWHTPYLERLGIKSAMMCDGPVGLRKRDKSDDGEYYTVKATCFPSAVSLASSWNRELAEQVGGNIGEECRAEQVSVLLGPGVNIKRSPLCGRNFEYYSEDPYLSGQTAAAFIRGVQSKGVAACVKHFCVNNQETRRFSTSANLSSRALHEIYMPSFEAAVKEGHVSAVMHSYNRVNGKYAGEDKSLITDWLRGKWGFDGIVMSDWNAISDRTAAYHAGTDLEMPPTGGIREKELLDAYKRGELTEDEINASVARVLKVIFEHLPDGKKKNIDKDAHHAAAAKALEECIVLLKNDGGLLPLEKGKPLAVIGGFAKAPRFQGGGSSHVEQTRLDDISEFVAEKNDCEISYAAGYDKSHNTDDSLISEAVAAAKKCGRALVFIGLPENYETEGRDRRHMRLPDAHNRLAAAVCAACKNTVVILLGGSPAELPWVSEVPALLHMYLGGQALGSAIAKTVFGEVNPSGKLAETHPVRLEDTPSYMFFPGSGDECFYGEDVYVGYRYYDKKNMEVLFPFGYGLSYTEFEYTAIRADGYSVSVTVKNVGKRVGKEVVELYCGANPNSVTSRYVGNSSFPVARPVRWLCGFDKVTLAPGEEKTVTFTLCDRTVSVFDEQLGDFRRVGGTYTLYAGGSSRNLPLSVQIEIEDDSSKPIITPDTTVEDILLDTRIPRDSAEKLLRRVGSDALIKCIDEGGFTADNRSLHRFVGYVLRQFIGTSKKELSPHTLDEIVEQFNSEIIIKINA